MPELHVAGDAKPVQVQYIADIHGPYRLGVDDLSQRRAQDQRASAGIEPAGRVSTHGFQLRRCGNVWRLLFTLTSPISGEVTGYAT